MSVERVDVEMGENGKMYALYVDNFLDITSYEWDVPSDDPLYGTLAVDPDVSLDTMEAVEDALTQALDVVRASHAQRLVGRRVRQKYNVTPFETGGETFHYYEGVVKDAEWNHDLERYTLAVLVDHTGEIEYNVEVDEYVEFLDGKAVLP